jgi:hypothetical protein
MVIWYNARENMFKFGYYLILQTNFLLGSLCMGARVAVPHSWRRHCICIHIEIE